MEHPLLKTVAGLAAVVLWSGCQLFNDPYLELDPARLHDSTLTVLPDSQSFEVARMHVLESFGSFGCTNCPDAESKLLPYIYPSLGSPGYNPRLTIVNYHVKFGTVNDPWVTAGTQARYDQSFANSLPQVTMDGSNSQFGIRETDARYDEGEYDSLVSRLNRLDSLTWLDLGIDTANLSYDSATRDMSFRFTVSNRDTIAQGALSFRVLAVKNLPVTIPIYPDPWDVIVVETTDKDASGSQMVLSGLSKLTAKTYSIVLNLPAEASNQGNPLGVEDPGSYAIVIFVKNSAGVVQNAVSYQYHPQKS